MPKLCKDCRHYRPAGSVPILFGWVSYGESRSVPVPDDLPRNVVDGTPLVGGSAHDPWFLRTEQGWCTPDGLMWEEIPPAPEPELVHENTLAIAVPPQPTFWQRISKCFK
ncbi:hypothetical protein D3C71_597380 [compost metagenome]